MCIAKATSDILPAPVGRRRHALTVTLWVLQVLLAFALAGGGWLKLSGAPEMVAMFATIGAGQWFRVMVGALEIAGAIGLLIPRIAGLAALGLSGLLVGASATNLFVLDADPRMPIGLLLMSALIACGRWPRTKTAQPSGQGPGQRTPAGAEPGLGRRSQHADLS